MALTASACRWVWEYPMTNASTGVKGLLEAAGHRVYNPTLPHHDRGAERKMQGSAIFTFKHFHQLGGVILKCFDHVQGLGQRLLI